MSVEDARLGSVVGGKYRISRFLAQGGMGTVYEAQHTVLRRRFAVKFLRPELRRRRDMLGRFQLEAQTAGALESENIAAAIDFGMTSDGQPYLVMEYLEGIELAALLRVLGTLPLERAADLVVQACAGMQRAHDAGVIHRDLKPQNLFVCRRSDETDLVKIVDFGVAKLLDEGAATGLTATGGMVGTPSYMSPEQARGEARIDARTDVYALGVILYELLSGHTPHPGESHNAIIHHISTQPPLPLAAHGRDMPEGLIAVVERALSPAPDARQPSAAEFARQLSPFAQRRTWPVVSALAAGLDSTVLAPAALEPAVAAKIPSGVSAAPLERSGTRAPPRRGLTALSVVALVFGVFVVIVLWSRRQATPPPALSRSEPALSAASATAEPPRTRPLDVQAANIPSADVHLSEPAPAATPAAEARSEPKPSATASKPMPPRAATPQSKPPKAVETPAPLVRAPAVKVRSGAEFDDQNPY
jgi:eukaryotic-like serine/threonine-protein kinase